MFMKPVSATECTCNHCGAEFYAGHTNPKRVDDYLWPAYCPMCGVRSLSISIRSTTGKAKMRTITGTVKEGGPSRVVDFDDVCNICGRTLKEHSLEGIEACADKEGDIKLKDVRCPICNKLVLEHSRTEGEVCHEKHRAQNR